jgi:hypothetical protein
MNTTFDPVADAARRIARPELRSIGYYLTGSAAIDYPMSWEDSRRDAQWIERYFADVGVGAGQFVVVVSTGHEAPWYGAVLDAVYELNATVCPLEPAAYELGRAQMFFRRFSVSYVFGLDLEVATALEKSMGLKTALAGVKVVTARPNALGYLARQGIVAGLTLPLGPALGLPCRVAGTVHVNETEWEVEEEAGKCLITAREARAHRPRREPLTQAAHLATEVCGCPHGSRGIRIVMEGE